jgi:ketosteroid isomerase-like protein
VSVVEDDVRARLERLYREFNARNIDAVLAEMSENVEWPNGWEGGYVHGHDEVRDYWTRQWEAIDPTVTPVDFASEPDGRVDVSVRQVVRDRTGSLLANSIVHHIYRFEGERITYMEIRD